MSNSIATLLTDFGLGDAYVAAMKGVLLGINPHISIIDVTHQVAPQNIWEGAFILGTSWRHFPLGTIHLAVVDPGVGTRRKALLLNGHGHMFLAPDNGLLSYIFPSEVSTCTPFKPLRSQVPEAFKAYELNNPLYWQHPISSTFHGRDIFAPVAAHLSLGVPADDIGDPVTMITKLNVPMSRWDGNHLLGHVLHIDRFGNVVTNVLEKALTFSLDTLQITAGGRNVSGVSSSYLEGNGLAMVIGSHGYLEIALTNGNAAHLLGMSVGDEVVVNAP